MESYFDRHGGKTILIGRFIGLVRALAPFIAGSSGLPYRRFIPYSIVGTGLWATLFCMIGYLFWRSFDRVAHLVGQAIFGFGLTVAVIVGVVMAYRRRREISDWFVAHERHPLVRPLLAVSRPLHRRVVRPVAHVAMPYLRFMFDRVSPGTLGLELTTLMAIAGVGIFTFVAYLGIAGDPGPTPLDTELLDLSDRIRNDMLVDVAKMVTSLGAFPTVAAARAGHRGVPRGAQALRGGARAGGGLALIYVAVNITKEALGRTARRSVRRHVRSRAIRADTRRTRPRGSPWRWRSRAGCGW